MYPPQGYGEVKAYMPTFDKKIVVYIDEKADEGYNKFCNKHFPRLSRSQVAWFAIKRFMDDHNPETIRGQINELFGVVGQEFFLKKYGERRDK